MNNHLVHFITATSFCRTFAFIHEYTRDIGPSICSSVRPLHMLFVKMIFSEKRSCYEIRTGSSLYVGVKYRWE